MATIRSFEDLECWKAANELRRELSQLIKSFPVDEKYGLVSQIRRASRGVTNCIAEGFGRYHYQEFIRFARMSRGSVFELIDHLIISQDDGYISNDQLTHFRSKIERCKALTNGLIKHLENKKNADGKVKEPFVPYGIDEEFILIE
jgi:four helix bundle protein